MKISFKNFLLINLCLMLMFPDVFMHLIATFPGFFPVEGISLFCYYINNLPSFDNAL